MHMCFAKRFFSFSGRVPPAPKPSSPARGPVAGSAGARRAPGIVAEASWRNR